MEKITRIVDAVTIFQFFFQLTEIHYFWSGKTIPQESNYPKKCPLLPFFISSLLLPNRLSTLFIVTVLLFSRFENLGYDVIHLLGTRTGEIFEVLF